MAAPFEKKFVNFKETKNPIKGILRVLGGGAIYFALNTALKIPFSSEFLSSPTMASFIVRAVRYCIVIFVIIGVYPLVFDRIGAKKD